MAKPTTKGNSLLDPKGSRELLKAVPLRAIADHDKASQIASQEGRSRAQSEITSFPGNQARQRKSIQVWRRAPDCAGLGNTRNGSIRSPGQRTVCRDTRQTRHKFGTKRL